MKHIIITLSALLLTACANGVGVGIGLGTGLGGGSHTFGGVGLNFTLGDNKAQNNNPDNTETQKNTFQNNDKGNTEMYGQIGVGVESVHR